MKTSVFQLFNYYILYWKVQLWVLIIGLILNTYLLFQYARTDYGIIVIFYSIFICIITTWFTFTTIQKFINSTKPIKLNWNIDKIEVIPDKNCVEHLSSDIDKYFIRKWFVEISHDNTFNEECRLILKDVMRQMFDVQRMIDKKNVLHSILNLYLRHLKEFRRGLKRKEKYGGQITELYRYSHSCSTSTKAKNYFLHQLTTNLLNHFISWELSNSLPYRILVAIITKKVVLYLLNLFSNPEFINYLLLTAFLPSDKKTQIQLEKYKRIKLINLGDLGPIIEESNSAEQKKMPSIDTVDTKETNENIEDINNGQNEPVLAQNKEISTKDNSYELKTEDVKIYEPKSCKTWYDSYDLESVTLGQDILDMIDDSKDIDVPDSSSKGETSPIQSAKNILNEMKNMTTIEGFKTSIKPISDVTLHNIKDFQESTVNNVVKPVSLVTSNAFQKIGGLHLQDEAAGVVEGILDFGRTKIRKGLRLTGLQDNIVEDASFLKTTQEKRGIVKMPRVKSHEKSEDSETTWINPIQEDNFKNENKSESDDFVHIPHKVPSILTHTSDDGSPEPEYEETADLATSIAKLRSLLEQKSSESGMSTPAVSPMPTEDFTGKMMMEDTDETDGMMPSFYKFCAKTATGVLHNTLNTIKTALPGNAADSDKFYVNEKWLFIEAPTTDNSLYIKMDKLLNERKVFCTVDTAYEAIDSLVPLHQEEELNNSNINFEDELDDLEVKVPITKVLLDIITELFSDIKDTNLTQECVIKSLLLYFGNYVDDAILSKLNAFINYWCASASIPEENTVETLEMDLETFLDSIQINIPVGLEYIIGGKHVVRHALRLFISSVQVGKINEDMVMQIFEIICLKLINGSKNLSPISA